MGKKSIKSDKNIYFTIRNDELGLTREEAANRMTTISESRLERIEYGIAQVMPEDIIELAKAYKHPELCNYYCSHECVIGKEYVPSIQLSSLSEIVLKMLSSFEDLEDIKRRLIAITSDGKISDDELSDFVKIQDRLEQLTILVDSLNLWVENTISEGKIDKSKLMKLKSEK
ncbi:helix-turn-helix domain-containing protein [Bilifractor sp. HCP3S3_D3]|uniref:helix-turn-helix domain-containing protein n=1 Tax=Bilifractor sp. HCP3S3_D3 TaxID=3438907 RepID=UPI003F8C1151